MSEPFKGVATTLSKVEHTDGKQTCVKWDHASLAIIEKAKPADQSLPEYLRFCAVIYSLETLELQSQSKNV